MMIHISSYKSIKQCQAHFRQCRMSVYMPCSHALYRPAILCCCPYHSKHSLVHCGTLDIGAEDSILQTITDNFGVSNPKSKDLRLATP